MSDIVNIAAYLFVALDEPAELREPLREEAAALNLKGTILLAHEGINLFLAGSREAIDTFLAKLRARPPFARLETKESFSATQPFRKLLVKLKKEIIPLGRPDVDPARHPAPRVSAQELRRWLDEGRELVLLDTRNQFEVDHGTFRGALDMHLKEFRSFPEVAEKLDPALKDKTIVTFCTGGIRCEKAAPLMIQNGFAKVYQLDGGILKYFEEVGSSHFDGNCYVFDERRALDSDLQSANLAPATTENTEQA